MTHERIDRMACIHERAWLLTISAVLAITGTVFGPGAPWYWEAIIAGLALVSFVYALFPKVEA